LRHHERQYGAEQRPGAPETLAEDHAGQKAHDNANDDILKSAKIGRRSRLRLIANLIGAFDRPKNRFCSGSYAASNVTSLEAWHDLLANDAGRTQIGQCPLEAVTDLDPELPLLERDQQEDAVVRAFAAELPGGRDAMGVLLKRLSLERRKNQYCHLITGFLFVCFQLSAELLGVLNGNDSGTIHDAPGQRRDVQCNNGGCKEQTRT
jgi:hypothetical protein